MPFAQFDTDAFLRDHWQKKPLLIRNPWGSWSNPLEPDELAGLACEDDVESRLILQKRTGWKLEHGPFAESRFAKLGKKPWTLLVQAVDHYAPNVAALIDPFRFIPNWRIDDVMVSYASDGGGVGPHFDQYDVFLVQGLGKRRWQIGPQCDATTPLLPHDDLRLLANFEATDEWILEPGDILYVPPGFAHNGVAVGNDCMTYSIGFRAPSRSELIAQDCDHVLESLAEDDRYGDPGLPLQDHPGEISEPALARLHAMITATLADRHAFAQWFGEYTTTPKYPENNVDQNPMTTSALRALLAGNIEIIRNPASRFSFIRRDDGTLTLFADGHSFICDKDTATLAETLCAHGPIRIDASLTQSDAAMTLLASLFTQGSLAIEEPE
ncbi:cupin [Sphingobium sp. SCG-1]|uniref:cupin domain-containing protein n=1 Tax=Sphingobium sp. SCG-1 TaxID=2072936 RepID=UPI000CD68B96|nr:cupin domain-containing protein [Sphingobium sp. SCG-1]AUW58841.1 cupin [Sphingobium sp. SCG-1]